MKIIPFMLALAQPQAADTLSYADLIAPVIREIGLPERLASGPVHFDFAAALGVFKDPTHGVYSQDAAGEDAGRLLARTRRLSGVGVRLRSSVTSDVLACETPEFGWPRCSVRGGGAVVSISEVSRVEDSSELRLVVTARWIGGTHGQRLEGYDLEMFLLPVAEQAPGARRAWRVSRTGIAIVL